MKHFQTIISIILLMLITTITSCLVKDIPKGKTIRADGIVIDSVKNKKLSNVKIYLYGVHSAFYSGSGVSTWYDNQPIDSTVSDGNGKFFIESVTDGTCIDYVLTIINKNINDNQWYYRSYTNVIQGQYIVVGEHSLYPFNRSYKLNNVELKIRELSPVKVALKIESNPYDSLYVDVSMNINPYAVGNGTNAYLYTFSIRNLFIGNSIDTIFVTRYIPAELNSISYKILSHKLRDSTNGFMRWQLDDMSYGTVFHGDTLMISKEFKSSYNIPLNSIGK